MEPDHVGLCVVIPRAMENSWRVFRGEERELTWSDLHFENILAAGIKWTGKEPNDEGWSIGKKFVVTEKGNDGALGSEVAKEMKLKWMDSKWHRKSNLEDWYGVVRKREVSELTFKFLKQIHLEEGTNHQCGDTERWSAVEECWVCYELG